MRTKIKRFRWLGRRLASPETRRIVVLTGARQTGKTTLARDQYPSLRYVNFDAIEEREALRSIRTPVWAGSVGDAILDEAQKEPSVFEKVKWAFDEQQIDFTVLLGSSRFLLLDKVRETLAGRSFLFDLWPLMASELRTPEGETPPAPLLSRLLAGSESVDEILESVPALLLGERETERREAIEHLALWGGMPGLLPLGASDRREWLRSYQQTFLERDLADLVRLNDLHPFRSLQQLCMLRSAQLLSYSGLARDAAIATTTARRYLEYLRISYQTVLIQPYARNLTSVVIKSPKLFWIDLGLLRQGTSQWGPLTGPMFETLVVGEIYKWVRTMAEDVRIFFYRTRSRLEVDLILQTQHGVVGIEIKNRDKVTGKDARGLNVIADKLGEAWRGGLIVFRGGEIAPVKPERSIWSMPIHRLV